MTRQPEKVLTPAERELVQPLRTAPFGPVPLLIERVMVLAYPVATFPSASLAVTAGWVVNTKPAVTPLGWVVKTSCEALFGATVNAPDVPVSVPWVAVKVVLCASVKVTDGVPAPLEKVTDAG